MVYGVYDRSDSRMRNLNYDYGRPVLPKFRERDVKIGAMHRTGREISEKFAAIGRSFKGLLSRTADLFISAPVRSARRFNRAHEDYSREADKLLDDLTTGENLDPEKLARRLAKLQKLEDEMFKHVAVKKWDGSRLTRAEAKNMPPEDLQKMQAAQARKLRRKLLEERINLALNKLSAKECNTFYSNVKKIDWNTVETEMEKQLDRDLNNLARIHEVMDADLPQEEIRAEAVKASKAIAEHLRNIRDLVDTRKMRGEDEDFVHKGVKTVFRLLRRRHYDTQEAIEKVKAMLNIMLEMQKSTEGNAQHLLERELAEKMSELSRGEAIELLTNLRSSIGSQKDWNAIRLSGTLPETARNSRLAIAKLLGVPLNNEEDDENFRLALKQVVTLHDMLENQAKTSVES